MTVARSLGLAGALLLGLARLHGAADAGPVPLQLVSRIPLGEVHGRIDHLAVDLGRRRLFVAELGNDSVGVVDVERSRTIRALTGLREPQGLGYVRSTDTLYVANAGDGSVRLFRGADLAPAGRINLGDDADDVRVDEAAHRLFVAYGTGAVAIIDTRTRTKTADIPVGAHPEGFEPDGDGKTLFVNVPDAGEIAVLDRIGRRPIATWRTGSLRENFPLALDERHGRVLVVFRRPAKLGVFRARDGRLLASLDTCRDADDLFLDPKRARVYVICGEGLIDVLAEHAGRYWNLGRIATAPGARTGLFVPQWNRLFVAVRATARTRAAIWVYRPDP